MKILVIGGTRFFGIHMVDELLAKGHDVTIATRGLAADPFEKRVERVILDHTDPVSMKTALYNKHFDVVIDKVAYCSNDIKYAMDTISCDKYIYMSSTAIYELNHPDVKEDEFHGSNGALKWCNRADDSYGEVKKQAEYALWQVYEDRKWIAVRYPYVVGEDDYTKRLLFYVEHVMNQKPMFIDNIDNQMSFINSMEAGNFLAYLVDTDFVGAINGCSYGTISIREILNYVEKQTGCKAIVSNDGEVAPYNGTAEHSVSIERATMLGYQFSALKDWMYELIDRLIECVEV